MFHQMKTASVLFAMACLLFSSCTDSPEVIIEQEQIVEFNKDAIILYQYKGVYVTRIDEREQNRIFMMEITKTARVYPLLISEVPSMALTVAWMPG
jgi:uncharacterized lipoprotein YajG